MAGRERGTWFDKYPGRAASLFRFPFLPPLRAVVPVRRSAASLAGCMRLMLAILSPDAEIVCASRPFLLYSAARLRGCFACRGGNHADDHSCRTRVSRDVAHQYVGRCR